MSRKRSFLLLELLIAFSLMAIIMQLLFSGYHQFIILKSQLQQETSLIMDRQRLFLKLKAPFSSLTSCALTPFGLYFTYENSRDIDPAFRGSLKAVLYVEDQTLILLSWVSSSVYRKERIYYHPQLISLSPLFFDPQTAQLTPHVPQDPLLIMKLKLEHETHTWELPFFL
ncbi:MAG: hypothetical protein QRY72_04515 [Candidatus Rhabdochlamydia sp.]